MEYYQAIIIDDEAINLLFLKKIINKYCPTIKLIGEASTADTALNLIEKNNPDIIFLDIMLKEGLVFEMIDKMKNLNAKIIFVTSETQFATKAFRYNAVDYLIKPVVATEVIKAVDKAAVSIKMMNFELENSNVLIKRKIKNLLAIPSIGKIELIKINEIAFFNSEGKYTAIYLIDGKKILSTKNLGSYEIIVETYDFFRIHHSYIINMHFVSKVVKTDGFYCEMLDGKVIPISKRRQEEFSRYIRIKN